MDLVARFEAYANDFERSYADRDWSRLASYFAADAVYECREPQELAFHVEGRDAILARFDEVANAFDRRFDSRSMTLDPPREQGTHVSVTGVAIYTLAGAPALRLPFSEVAEYRRAEIVRLEDASTAEAIGAVAEWMARYGARLHGVSSPTGGED
jgi:SnoaL-like domain